MRKLTHLAVALLVISIFPGCSTPPQPANKAYGSDLVITETADRQSVTVGKTITLTITVSNLGPNNASGIIFGSDSPVALEYISFSCGAAAVTSHGFCELDHLLSGKSVIAHIVARPINASMSSKISLNSRAFIAEYIAFDPNKSNNSTSLTIEILPKTMGKTH